MAGLRGSASHGGGFLSRAGWSQWRFLGTLGSHLPFKGSSRLIRISEKLVLDGLRQPPNLSFPNWNNSNILSITVFRTTKAVVALLIKTFSTVCCWLH